MNKIRCGIYDRVSHDTQVQHGLSLDTQNELLTEYAESHGYEIIDYYVDEGITARKKLQNRKDFMRLLEDIKKDKIDLVLVTKLDRWFRNVRDYHNTQAILEEHNCNWKTILEDYDTTTADGQLKINIMLSVAQNESDRTSERIKVIFDHKRRLGEHINGRPSYGYKVVNKKLQKNESQREIVEDFFQYYLTTLSKRKTIIYISEKYGDRAPSQQMMDKMMKKEVYCGRRGADLSYCEPYITPQQFELIQSVCSSKTYLGSTHEPYIFSQLLKCPHCGATMTGFLKHHTCKDGTVTEYKRYRCSKKFASEHPVGACITESVIEEYMIENVDKELDSLLYKFFPESKKKKTPIDYSLSLLSEIDRLNSMYQKGRISDEYYDNQYETLQSKLRNEQNKKTETIKDYKHVVEQFSGNWISLYKKLDAEHKNIFWKKTIREITIDESTHKINGFTFLPYGCSK